MVISGARSWATVVVVSGLVAVLAACGSSGTSSGADPAVTATSSTAPIAYVARCWTPPADEAEAEPLEVRPTEVPLGCEGSSLLRDVTWTAWTSTSAAGAGTLDQSSCDPSCAEGTRTDYAATIVADRPATNGCGRFFSRLRVTYTDSPTLPPDSWETTGNPPTVTLDGMPAVDGPCGATSSVHSP